MTFDITQYSCIWYNTTASETIQYNCIRNNTIQLLKTLHIDIQYKKAQTHAIYLQYSTMLQSPSHYHAPVNALVQQIYISATSSS